MLKLRFVVSPWPTYYGSLFDGRGGKPLVGVYVVVSRIHVPLVPAECPICLSPSSFPSRRSAAQDSVLWMEWRRRRPLGKHPALLGRPGTDSHALTLPCRRNHRRRGSLLALSCAALEEGVIWVKSNCFSYPLQCILVISPCPRQCVESFPPETWISARALLSLGDYLRQSSPGTPRLWLRWAGAGPQTTSGSTARTEVYVPITQSIGEWHTSEFLSIGCWIPELLQSLLSIEGCKIVVVEGGRWETSSLAILLTSLCWSLNINYFIIGLWKLKWLLFSSLYLYGLVGF